ncbi:MULTISPECIES: putative signal transducing protein [Flammeovirga]|uniref:DUF2007 domain-containing protein n=1 Tax=Flammeovirga agarivorans TaxID=2726742 RepID=A0A7X8SN31_9BACT|nr:MULTISPECIES: DUF2007 domain-containing protein [Flammeovirga]NLR93221.1 DUF2007 domain-containing protein [Flammeovirga agarivorans]
MVNWEKVYTTEQVYKAEIVKATLEERGINAVILDKRDSSYNNFGYREVYVDKANMEKATLIIKQDVEFE